MVVQDREAPVIKRRQLDGSLMKWVRIYSDKLIGPYKVDDGLKLSLTSLSYKFF